MMCVSIAFSAVCPPFRSAWQRERLNAFFPYVNSGSWDFKAPSFEITGPGVKKIFKVLCFKLKYLHFRKCTWGMWIEEGCFTTQQVDEGVMVWQALTLKAIRPWEMSTYKYILLNCISCLATARPVLTFDPLHLSLLPHRCWPPTLIHVLIQKHVGNGEAFHCTLFWDAKWH